MGDAASTSSGSTSDRLFKDAEKRQKALEKHEAARRKKEMEGVTFKPDTSFTKGRRSTTKRDTASPADRKGKGKPRPVGERLFQQARENDARKEKLRADMFAKNHTFQPELVVRSPSRAKGSYSPVRNTPRGCR